MSYASIEPAAGDPKSVMYLDRAQTRSLQDALGKHGYTPGPVDGILDKRTAAPLWFYSKEGSPSVGIASLHFKHARLSPNNNQQGATFRTIDIAANSISVNIRTPRSIFERVLCVISIPCSTESAAHKSFCAISKSLRADLMRLPLTFFVFIYLPAPRLHKARLVKNFMLR